MLCTCSTTQKPQANQRTQGAAGWDQPDQGAALWERAWGCWWTSSIRVSSVLLQQRANSMLGCICKGITGRNKDDVIPLHSALVRPHLKFCVRFGPCYPKMMWTGWKGSSERPQLSKRLGSLPYDERLKELYFLRKEGFRETLSPCSSI